jgi:arylsulfatase A-like enzyme
MKEKRIFKGAGFMLLLFLVGCQSSTQKKGELENVVLKPNVVYILADDLGYGDLSCYGQEKFETPNLDRLAANGIKFTQHYAGSTVCAPSRSSLLTGETTGHTPVRGNMEVEPEGQAPLPATSFTIAEMMKNAGYVTGAYGKWGLGYPGSEGDPNNQGFDQFFGYNCQRMAHRYYPAYLWHNQEKVHLAGNDWKNTVTYAQDEIQKAALQFITDNKDTSFFAFIPYVLPHAELISPDDSIYANFKRKFDETPFVGQKGADYGPDLEIWKYNSQPFPRAAFASMVVRLDAYVGQVIDKLDELGLSENTIVMFASDNGPHQEGGADPVFFNCNGGLRGFKRDLYEGGIRTPFIVDWPNKIKAGTLSDHISAFWDVMPTLADIVGVKVTSSNDGISFLPELLGQKDQKKHDYLYWEFHEKGGRKAVRLGDWKGVVYHVNNPQKAKMQLYNLSTDPAEKNDVAKDYPDIVKQISEIMKDARTESVNFNFGAETLLGDD